MSTGKSSKPSKDTIRVLLSVVFLAMGIFVLVNQEAAMQIIVIVMGIALLAYGGIQVLLNARKRRHNEDAAFIMPVIAVVLGILLLLFQNGVASLIIPIIVSVWALITGIMCLIDAMKIRRSSRRSAFLAIMVLSLVQIAVGAVLLIRSLGFGTPPETVLFSVCLIAYGVASIVSFVMLNAAKKHMVA